MSDTFEIRLDRINGYRFQAEFPGTELPALFVDEPPPLGDGSGPNPARLLATAVGNCLSASLIFCLGKSRVEVGNVTTNVIGSYRRNERNRLRIERLRVAIVIEVPGDDTARLRRCLGLFEDYCVVTASVRDGIEVELTVTDSSGDQLFASSPR